MGKKKFDKNKGVTFKLVFRSEDDQANSDQTLSERIFSVIEADKKKADQENDKERQKILSQFTKEELGQAPAKKAKPHHGAIKASAPPTDAISSQTKGREDLWITHVMRMKEQAKLQAEAEEAEEEERREALLKKAKQPVKKAAGKKEEEDEEWEDDEEGEDEEWEDEDEEDDEEAEEYEEIEEEDEEEEVEDIQLVKKKAADDDEEQGNKNVLEKIEDIGTEKKLEVTDEDFPELGAEGPSKPHRFIPESEKPKTKEQVLEEIAEEEIDLKKVNVKGAVRMKRYDDMGLPIDGYNYYQHVVDANSGGAPSFAFTTTYDTVQKLPEDLDLKKEKMNAEEKEVYEALEAEGEGGYEDLEDDFFTSLTKAEAVVVEEGGQASNQDGKKVTFGDNEIKEILSTKDEKKPAASQGKDSILSRKDFQKVLKQHVEDLKEKYKDERQKNRNKYGIADTDSEEEEEEVEEVDESWDDDDEENRPKGYIERVKWEDDYAAQQCVAKSMSSLDSEEDEEERRTRASKAANTTRPNSEYQFQQPVRQAKLNIVKEATTTTTKKHKGGKEAENKEKTEEKEEKESDSEGEEDEDEEEEEEKNKVEEVFKKREKGETKEEKKARKAAIKQFKQERKEKKKKFKENFESKKKEHITMAHKQSNSLQGLSIYKLTV